VTLLYAGALGDPLIGGVQKHRQIVVGHDFFRHIAAAA
jgi:hypothetical protein